MDLAKIRMDKYRGKYSSLAKGERGQIVNLSAPIGEVARSAVGEVSRRGKKAAFTPHRSGYSATNFGKTPRLLRSAGFTLAEVLITIGIIGVVSALTIPNLIQEHQKRATVTKLQKGISVINQAYKLSFDDLGDIDNPYRISREEYLAKYWAPYIKTALLCSERQDRCGYKTNTALKYPNGGGSSFNLNSTRISFATMDGFVYHIVYHLSGTISRNIFLDINAGQGPNRLGRDVFVLDMDSENGIKPLGFDKSNNEVKDYCLNSWLSNTCAEYIKRNNWKIPKDYPW